MTRLPCMAVKQPWADLLVRGIKDVENRNSAMHANLVGQWCAIYASRTMATVGQWTDAKWSVGFTNTEHWPWDLDVCAARKQCARGAIVGLMRWSGSTRNWSGDQMSPWAESGAHHWTYSDHLVLPEPVQLPDGGKQSLYWYLDAETHSAVIESLGRMPLKQVVALAIDALSGGEVL